MESEGAQNSPPQPSRSKAERLARRTAVALLAAVVSVGVAGLGLAEEAEPPPAMRAGVLENPTDGSHTSGIGVASGWVCDASEVVVVIDGALRLRTAYGTPRGDTLEVCGDTDNGFAVLFNWNLLGDGEHSVVAYADETEIGRATFHVTTLGSPFLRGVQALYAIPDFPHEGSSVGLRWVESAQGFRFVAPPGETVSPIASPTPAISDAPSAAEPAPVGALENPHDGGHMSGIGIASGWVCGAKEVVVEIDGATRLKAAYPTERFDTSILCGSAATGFAVLFNWALLGDGLHTAVARADGIEFDRATFEVRTLGAPFVRGLERTLLLEDFPAPGTDLELRWAQAEQAFKISGLLPQSTPILASPTPSASPTVTPTATPSPTPQIIPTPLPSATAAPDPAISLTPSPPPTPSPTPAPTPPVPSGCPSGTMPDGGNGYPGQISARLADHQRVVYCAELRRPARRVEFRVDSICGDAGGSNVLLTVTPPALSSSDGRPLVTMVSDSMPAKAIYGALTRPAGYIPAGTFLFDVLGQTPGANCGSTSNVKISWAYSE